MILLFTACLLASPVDCRNERIALDSAAPPFACMTTAPAMLAEWAGEHPERGRIASWACVSARRLQRAV